MKDGTKEWIWIGVGYLGILIILISFFGGIAWIVVDMIQLLFQEAKVTKGDFAWPAIMLVIAIVGPVVGIIITIICAKMAEKYESASDKVFRDIRKAKKQGKY
jgi:hypothetical protein